MREVFGIQIEPAEGNSFDWISYKKNLKFKQKIKMEEITEMQHWRKNYMWVTFFMLGMALLGWFTAEEPLKYFISGAFIGIILIIFIGNRISWKKKFRNK